MPASNLKLAHLIRTARGSSNLDKAVPSERNGADVKARFVDLKKASADRCARDLGTFVKAPEVQFHHEVYNQFLWNKF